MRATARYLTGGSQDRGPRVLPRLLAPLAAALVVLGGLPAEATSPVPPVAVAEFEALVEGAVDRLGYGTEPFDDTGTITAWHYGCLVFNGRTDEALCQDTEYNAGTTGIFSLPWDYVIDSRGDLCVGNPGGTYTLEWRLFAQGTRVPGGLQPADVTTFISTARTTVTIPSGADPLPEGCPSSSDLTGGTQSGDGPSFVLAAGLNPQLPIGVAVWQQTDGSTSDLAASSPAPNQVRYEVDGLQVTLTGAPGTNVTNGLVANAAGEVECEICATLVPGGVIEAWMFSEPRLVAAWRIEDLPCQRFTIPVGTPLDGGGPVSAGAHTLQLALPTASGMQAVNVGVTVGGPVPGSVPAGEGAVPTPAWLFALALLASAGAVVAVRRQVVAR
jgi:hypothetical protein